MQVIQQNNNKISEQLSKPISDTLVLEEKFEQSMFDKLKKIRKEKSLYETQKKEQKVKKMQTNVYQTPIKTNFSTLPQVQEIYQETKQFISNFDTTIVKCKKFNEVKTFRKYEVIIRDMEIQIQKLRNQLQMEQQMKSPTKQYLNEILSKLVEYKQQNNKLKKQVQSLNLLISNQKQEIQKQKTAIHMLQNNLKVKISKFPSIQTPTINVQESVKKFFVVKKAEIKEYNLPISKFHSFLNKISEQLYKFDLPKLLNQIDKWAEGIQDNHKTIDMWKIRYGVSKKFSPPYDQQALESLKTEQIHNNSINEINIKNNDSENIRSKQDSYWKNSNKWQ